MWIGETVQLLFTRLLVTIPQPSSSKRGCNRQVDQDPRRPVEGVPSPGREGGVQASRPVRRGPSPKTSLGELLPLSPLS